MLLFSAIWTPLKMSWRPKYVGLVNHLQINSTYHYMMFSKYNVWSEQDSNDIWSIIRILSGPPYTVWDIIDILELYSTLKITFLIFGVANYKVRTERKYEEIWTYFQIVQNLFWISFNFTNISVWLSLLRYGINTDWKWLFESIVLRTIFGPGRK
jgi:hypothetical protein